MIVLFRFKDWWGGLQLSNGEKQQVSINMSQNLEWSLIANNKNKTKQQCIFAGSLEELI